MHPYETVAGCQVWYKGVTAHAPGHLDPVTVGGVITKTDKVATIGSCFAQHIARKLSAFGFHYFVPKLAPADMSATEARAKNFGVFSARYGSVYTPKQALQLFDRAFGNFHPSEQIWRKGEIFVDAFRPQIEPAGYASHELLLAARNSHLEAVRRVFSESDWLVFTLGLTEAWRSNEDGAILPLAPGVSGGEYDETKFSFKNFSVREVIEDLTELVAKATDVNNQLKILLTVSPVPLIATYETRHVLESTIYSKSVLRVLRMSYVERSLT